MTANKNFLETLNIEDFEVTKHTSGRGSKHTDAYINKCGRLFNVVENDEFDKYLEIKDFMTKDGILVLAIKPAEPVSKDDKGNDVYAKDAYKSSAKLTKKPFVTVTNLCYKYFDKDDKETWKQDFVCQGEKDGYTFYALTK